MGALTNKIAIVFNALIAGGIASGASLLLKLGDAAVWAVWICLFALFSLIQALIYFRTRKPKVSARLAANSNANRAVSDELEGGQNLYTEQAENFETSATGPATSGSRQNNVNEADTTVFNHSFPFDLAERESDQAELDHDAFEDLTEKAVDSDADLVNVNAPSEDFGGDLDPIDESHEDDADLPAVAAHKSGSFDLTDHFPISEEGGSGTSSIVFDNGMAAAGSVALAHSIEIEPDIDRLPDPELADWARPIVAHSQPIGQIREGVNAIGEVSGDDFETPMPDPSDVEEETPLLASVLRNKVEELQAARLDRETGFSEDTDLHTNQALGTLDVPDDFAQDTEEDQSVEQLTPEFFDVYEMSTAIPTREPENRVDADFSSLQEIEPTSELGEFNAAESLGADAGGTANPQFDHVVPEFEPAIDEAPLETKPETFDNSDVTEHSNENSAFQTIDVRAPAQNDDRRTNTREILVPEVPALKDAFDLMALEEMTLSSGRATSGIMGLDRLGIAGLTTSFEGELPPMGEPDTGDIEVDEIEVDEFEISEPDPRPVGGHAINVAKGEQFQDGSSTGEEETVVMKKIAAAINRQTSPGLGTLQNSATSSVGDDFLDITSEIGGMSIPDQRPTASVASLDPTNDNLLMDLEDLLGMPVEAVEHTDENLEIIGGEVDQANAGSQRDQLHAVSGRSVDNIGGLATAAILAAIPEPEVDVSACQIWTNDCGDPDAFVEEPDLEVSEPHTLETLTVPVANQVVPLTDDAADLMDELGSFTGEPEPALEKAGPELAEVTQVMFEEEPAPVAGEVEPGMVEFVPLEFATETSIEETEPAVAEAQLAVDAAGADFVDVTPLQVATDTVIEDIEPAFVDADPVLETGEVELAEIAPVEVAADISIENTEPAAAEAHPVMEAAEADFVNVMPPQVATDSAVEDTEPAFADTDPVVEAAEPELAEMAPLEVAADTSDENVEPEAAEAPLAEEAAEPGLGEASPPEVAADTSIDETEPAAVEAHPVVYAVEADFVNVMPLEVAADTTIEDTEPAFAEADPVVEAAESELAEIAPVEVAADISIENTEPAAAEAHPVMEAAEPELAEMAPLEVAADTSDENVEPEAAEAPLAEEAAEPGLGEASPPEVAADTAIEDTEPAFAEADPVVEAAEPEPVEMAPLDVAADISDENAEPAVAEAPLAVDATDSELGEVVPLEVAADTAIEDTETAFAEADPVVEAAEPEPAEMAPLEVAADISDENVAPEAAEAPLAEEAAEPGLGEASPPEVAADTAIEDTEPAFAEADPVVEAAEPESAEMAPLEVAADTSDENVAPEAAEAPLAEAAAEPGLGESSPPEVAVDTAIEDTKPTIAEADPTAETVEPEMAEATPLEVPADSGVEQVQPVITEVAPHVAHVEAATEVPASAAFKAEKPLIAKPGAAAPAAEQVSSAVEAESASKLNAAVGQNSDDTAAMRLEAATAALAPSRVRTGASPVFEIRPDVLDTIRYALEYDAIDLFMQPIVDMKTKKVRFFEALSRVRGPDDEYILPDRYLKPATESGVISVIDVKMLTQAIQILRKLAKSGREIGVFFNLALHTLQDEKSFFDLIDLLRGHADLSSKIVFELTQPMTKQLGEDEWDRLREISTLGFVFSMDNVTDWVIDFGLMSGRGFRYIKVDGNTMKRGMADNGAMVRAEDLQAALTRRGVTIIGEKLETKDDLNLYRRCDIGFVQGFLVGKPKHFDIDSI